MFQPLLYQVATGSDSVGEIAEPLRSVLSRQKNTRVFLGYVQDIDPEHRDTLPGGMTTTSPHELLGNVGNLHYL